MGGGLFLFFGFSWCFVCVFCFFLLSSSFLCLRVSIDKWLFLFLCL